PPALWCEVSQASLLQHLHPLLYTIFLRGRTLHDAFEVALYEASDPLQGICAVRLEPQHEDRLRVGRADEPPAIGKKNTDTVRVHDGEPRPIVLGNFLHHGKLDVLGTVHPDL